MRRSLLTTTTAAALVSLLATPASAATTARGTATSTSVPLHVEAIDVPVDVGRLSLTATTDSETTDLAPWSAVGLTLVDVAGATFGDVSVRSDGETTSEGLSLSRDTAVGTVAATVADISAVADDVTETATSSLTTLTTEATILQDLGLDVTVSDVMTDVDDTAASATHTLTLAEVDLGLAALLGGVLEQLPLDVLLALADELGVTVPDGLGQATEVVDATQTLLDDVATATTAATDVEGAAADLLDADGGVLARLTDLQAQVVALDPMSLTFMDDLTDILTDPLLADCVGSLDQAAATTCIDGLLGTHLTSLDEFEVALADAVTAYLDAVAAVVMNAGAIDSTTLSGLLDGLDQLLADLLAADLLALSPIEVHQEVRAVGGDVAASYARHECRDTAITVLAGAPVDIADCDGGGAVADAVATVSATLTALLDQVGGAGAGDGVSLELFGVQEDVVAEREDGFVTATSVLEVLRLTVPDVTVTPCDVEAVGEVVCALGEELDLLSPLTGAIDDLGLAQTAVDTALSGVDELLTALASGVDGTPAEDPVAAVQTVVTALGAALDGLDLLGLGLAQGVVVPGATVVVDPELEAEHQVVTAASDPIDPADPAPDPTDPTLPNTGGGAALLAAIALGAGVLLLRRREDG